MTKTDSGALVLEREAPVTAGRAAGGDVDVQIATAKRYPRSIRAFIDKSTEMATLDEETAKACFYALPRDGKTVTGPSARLAEICVAAYGNLRAQARIVDEDDRFITARGEAWDIEANTAIAFEVRRRITTSEKTNRDGTVIPSKKYSDDMVGVTGNAASSIALRNAVFKIIPSAFWRPIYEKARTVAVGNAATLATRRAKMLEHFQKLGVEGARVFGLLGVRGVEDVTLEHMETLIGIATAIKEGDTTIDQAFADVPAPPQRKSDQAPAASTTATGTDSVGAKPVAGEMPSDAAGAVGGPAGASAAPASLPDGVDRILEAAAPRADKPTLLVAKTERGLQLYAYSQKVDLKGLVGVPVRLIVGNQKWGQYVECMAAEVVK